MKFGEDFRMSVRSIIKRYIETILLVLGIALGVGVTAAGIAMAARSSRDASELLASPQYREIVVTVREDAEDMELPAVKQVDTQQIILTSADLGARDVAQDIEYAYIANRTEFRLNFGGFERMGQVFQQGQHGQADRQGEQGEQQPTPPAGEQQAPSKGRTGTPPADSETDEGSGESQQEGQNQQELIKEMQQRISEFQNIPTPEGPEPVLEEMSGYEVSPDFFNAWEFQAAQGSLFTLSDMESGAPIMVIGSTLAETLYEDGESLGREILVIQRRQLFKITGILEPTGTTFDNMAFIPAVMPDLQSIAGFARMFMGWNTTLHFTVSNASRLEEAQAQLTSWFDQAYGAGLVNISVPREEAEATRSRNSRLVTIVLFLAFSGLLIAAVNVSNILFSRALRRRKSVGILKALGATVRNVFWLFFLEGLFIGVSGALLGGAISFLTSHLMETTMGFRELSIGMLFIGILVAWEITTMLTVLPAIQASRIPAAEAIRYE